MAGLTTASERNIYFQNNVDIVLKEHLLLEVLQNIHYLKISRKKDPINSLDDKSESRLYVENLDLRISEAALIKMFSPYGKIVAEDFLWHIRGPKRGEPRDYAFVQFSTKEEAVLAKDKMHEKLVCGRPLVVRLASEKYFMKEAESSFGAGGETSKSNFVAGSSAQMSKTAKIAAIKNKLKAMEEENQNSKRPKIADKLSDS
ncbi:uncharacterized protein LOC107802813 [Nicotiana tabacum]|uniref:Probable RNA-binding protein 18 n=1 Tax=Nicotiana tabacum TaxID=4097 RepID=A0A1S4AYY7_TOBAC|nr:PREDICTED: probable RNA-binding protein 18 [Nicotiana tabacum]